MSWAPGVGQSACGREISELPSGHLSVTVTVTVKPGILTPPECGQGVFDQGTCAPILFPIYHDANFYLVQIITSDLSDKTPHILPSEVRCQPSAIRSVDTVAWARNTGYWSAVVVDHNLRCESWKIDGQENNGETSLAGVVQGKKGIRSDLRPALGTLEQFATVDDHHVARHGFDCDHFTPERRPHCVQFSYSRCDTTPVHALRGTDLYRKDGQSGPFLFKLWPIALRDVATPLEAGGEDVAPARSFPALAVHRRKKPTKVRQRPKTIHGIDSAMLQEAQALAGSGAADGKLDHSLSKSQPSVLVSVDTSGAGFERMASFRQSQRGLHGDDTIDRKRRRRTVSGVPNNILQEIEQFEQDRRIDRGTRRKYSLDDLDPVDLDARDKMMQQYLLEIDAAREEREEEAYAEQREGKLLKFLPCRRSRSLPRCVQLMATSLVEGGGGGSIRRSKRASKSPLLSLSRLSLYTKRGQSNSSQRCRDDDEGDEIRLEPRQSSAILADSRRFSSSASLGSSASGAGRTARSLLRRGSRSGSLKRQSVIGEKLRSLVTNTLLRPRPKSLDLDAIELEEDKISPSRIAASSPSVVVCGTGNEGSKRRRSRKDNSGERSSSLSRLGSSSATKETSGSSAASLEPSRAESSRDVHVGPGSYYYFDSNHTLPRAQARKYDFPWDSLPKDWTTSVKLREISKRRKEDRQSSSGRWLECQG
ncbi:hypothetical protein PoB_003885300 [Plakobranchus ocellatus]|uniref:Uncharacterized protein n=1 Tax=Plakobranchus ocellatus TaxID=259542 RepID=A0AAV4AZR8_9GAST|nr:hypothetical protein PoB_003885300 [Plakobranchus ocellatus]